MAVFKDFKLYYFNARGRAEPTRLCFVAGGVKYEDIRYTAEEWQQKKKEGISPLGYLPLLEVDGKKLNESMTIMKYVARECGLAPSDSFQIAQCDMIVDIVGDLLGKLMKFFFEKDEETKKVYKEEFDSKHLPTFMANTTALLKGNNGGQGFFVGSKLTYADILMFHIFGNPAVTQVLDNYAELKGHYQRIGQIPAIKAWIENRPQTAM